MGIKNINTLVKKYCSHRFVDLPLKKFSGKKFAVDTSYFMYKLKAIATKSVVERTEFEFGEEGWNDIDVTKLNGVWLENFINMYIACEKNNVGLVFVLDGVAPEEKMTTQEGRRQKTKNANQKQKEYKMNPEKLDKYRQTVKNNTFLTQADRLLILKLFHALKCEVVQAKGEAEKHCAKMCNQGRVFAAVSADTDLLAYGCKVIITDINFMNPYYDPTVNLVVMADILKTLNMSQEEFLFLCILSGNDFNQNIPTYGPANCYNLTKEHGVVEDGKFNPQKTFERLVELVPEFKELDFATSFKVFTCDSEEMDLPVVEKMEMEEFFKIHLESDKTVRFLRILKK